MQSIYLTRDRLRREYPYLSGAIFAPRLQWGDRIHTACISPDLILTINKAYWQSLDEKGRMHVFLHELAHPARRHFSRKANRDHYLWNIACDVVIELHLARLGYSIPHGLYEYSNMTEEEIYDKLLAEGASELKGLGYGQDMGEGEVATEIEGRYAGLIGDTSNTILGRLFPTQSITITFPFDQVLRTFLQNATGDDEDDWADAEQEGRLLYPEPCGSMKKIYCLIDISSSVPKTAIAIFRSVAEQSFSDYAVEYITFNQSIVQRFKDEVPTELKTGGGTDLRVPFRLVQEEDPSANCPIVVFSDLETPMPAPRPRTGVYILGNEKAPAWMVELGRTSYVD